MPDLPTGTVTFLFTDIEGSTQLVHQLRERYAALLAEYRSLLRAVVAAHGGQDVDTQGDSFFVVVLATCRIHRQNSNAIPGATMRQIRFYVNSRRRDVLTDEAWSQHSHLGLWLKYGSS